MLKDTILKKTKTYWAVDGTISFLIGEQLVDLSPIIDLYVYKATVDGGYWRGIGFISDLNFELNLLAELRMQLLLWGSATVHLVCSLLHIWWAARWLSKLRTVHLQAAWYHFNCYRILGFVVWGTAYNFLLEISAAAILGSSLAEKAKYLIKLQIPGLQRILPRLVKWFLNCYNCTVWPIQSSFPNAENLVKT